MKTNYTNNSISELIANLSEDLILDLHEMISIKGGNEEGEENGSEPIIIIPKEV